MIDPHLRTILLNSRAGAAVSRAIGRQNVAARKPKPAPKQTTIKAPK